MRKILYCSSQVTSEILSLDLGVLPVRHIIQMRRVIYFQHILKQKKGNSLIFQFLKAQEQQPKSNKWLTQVSKDLIKSEINMSQFEIENMKTEAFKMLCKTKVKKIVFQYFEEKKLRHQLVKHINHNELEIANYLKDGDTILSEQERQYLF